MNRKSLHIEYVQVAEAKEIGPYITELTIASQVEN